MTTDNGCLECHGYRRPGRRDIRTGERLSLCEICYRKIRKHERANDRIREDAQSLEQLAARMQELAATLPEPLAGFKHERDELHKIQEQLASSVTRIKEPMLRLERWLARDKKTLETSILEGCQGDSDPL